MIIVSISFLCICVLVIFLYKTYRTYQDGVAIAQAKKAGTYSFYVTQKNAGPSKMDNVYIRSFWLESQD